MGCSNPLNKKTQFEMEVDKQELINNALAILGEALDRNLVWEALQMPGSGVPNINGRSVPAGHESLALVGDRVASLIMAVDSLLDGSGMTTTIQQYYQNNDKLAAICDEAGLTACINRNPAHEGDLGGRTKKAAVKALIGAAYLTENDAEMAKKVMKKLGVLKWEPVVTVAEPDVVAGAE